MCGNEQVHGYFYTKNVQFQNVSFFIKVSEEENFLFLPHGETNGKSTMSSYLSYLLDARMRIHGNINPNWAIEVCK